ncbi:MAG: hypothetical protein K2N27_01335, partial [Ruminococcus sp.]|nr:hypothetical protein [Ruminococcus sp.]
CSNITKFFVFADKGSFAYKNALKTQNTYNNIKIKELPFDVSKGVENVLFNNIADVLILFCIFTASVFVFTKDKEIGIMNLLFSCPKGRSGLYFSKMSVMIIVSLVLEIIFISALLIINGVSYGFGDLSRPVQSVNGFMECSCNFSVIQYMFLSFFIKWLGYGVFAMLFSCICICSKNGTQIYGISLFVSAVEILLYTKISRVTNLGLLHDLNIISFIKPDNMIAIYRNLNIFGQPFNAVIVIPIVWFISFVAFLFVGISVFCNSRNHEYKKLSFKGKILHKEKVHTRMYYAFKKSLSLHGSLLIIFIWLVAVSFYHIGFTKPASLTDYYYKQYTEQCQGNINEITDELIISEKQYFDELDEKMMTGIVNQNDYQNEQFKRQALERLSFRIDTVRNRNNAEIFYDTGYIRAFGLNEKNEICQLYLFMLILCVLTVSPIISYDKSRGLTAVIYSTSTGKKSYLKRCIALTSIYSIASSVIVIVPYFINILRKYGTQGISAPIQSIAESADSILPLNIWQYTLCLFVIRTIIIWLCSLAMLVISYHFKSRFTATLLNITVFIMPLMIVSLIMDNFW